MQRPTRSIQTHLKQLLAAALIITACALPSLASANSLGIGGPSDCDDNAIIKCGAHTTDSLVSIYNKSSYMHAVYADLGISADEMNNLTTTNVVGSVSQNGDVFVNGQSAPVATGAVTGGRQDITGSAKVTLGSYTYYKRTTSISFKEASLPAYISMVNGKFQFAVLAACGNAVAAQAVVSAPKPTPAAPVTTTPTPTLPTPAATPTPAAAATVIATPTKLANTGPSGVVAVFLIASTVGFYSYRRRLLRRLS